MRGLLGAARPVRSITINGQSIAVPGLDLFGLKKLVGRYGELSFLVNQGKPSDEDIFNLSADAMGALLAAGCGFPGDAEQEEAARRISMPEQILLMAEILEATHDNLKSTMPPPARRSLVPKIPWRKS